MAQIKRLKRFKQKLEDWDYIQEVNISNGMMNGLLNTLKMISLITMN